MRRRERVLAGLLGAVWSVTMVVLVQEILEQPTRVIPLSVIGTLSFLVIWIWTDSASPP